MWLSCDASTWHAGMAQWACGHGAMGMRAWRDGHAWRPARLWSRHPRSPSPLRRPRQFWLVHPDPESRACAEVPMDSRAAIAHARLQTGYHEGYLDRGACCLHEPVTDTIFISIAAFSLSSAAWCAFVKINWIFNSLFNRITANIFGFHGAEIRGLLGR